MKNISLPSFTYFTASDDGGRLPLLKEQDLASSISRIPTTKFLRAVMAVFALLLLAGTSFAQVTLPSADRCTSKDLELVSARLDVAACQSCTEGQTITAPLLLAIDNKTGSTRTSFAFWGTLVIKNSDNTVYSTTYIRGCNGPIVKDTITEMPFNVVKLTGTGPNPISSTGQITYLCGQTLELTGLYLAWTDAAKKSTCETLTLHPELIAPKCGTLPSIAISTGLSASAIVTQISCNGTNDGAINLSVFGGIAPFTYDWADLPGTNDPQDRTGLSSGAYSVIITDANGCTANYSTTLNQPTVVARPVVTVTEATLCDTVRSPYVTILCPISGATYSLTQTGVSGTKSPVLNTNNGKLEIRGLQAGRGFSITVTVNGCTSDPTTCLNYMSNSCPTASTNTSSSVTAKAPASVGLAKDSKLVAYPIPFSDRTTIQFKSARSEDYVINLYDLNGTLIKKLRSGKAKANEAIEIEVDGSGLTEGMYLARKISKSGMSSVKLLKKR
ncbi:T9SS type A sorting domain-containing protein [Rufibacter soli]